MKTFSELEKNCKKDMNGLSPYRLAVLGDCATQHLCKAIRGYGYEESMSVSIWEADYNQIEFQLADPDSELYQNEQDAVFFMMCQEKLYEAYCETEWEERVYFAERMLAKIRGYWEMFAGHSDAKILQSNFTLVEDGVFGNYANRVEGSYAYQVRKLNFLLMQEAATTALGKRVFIVDLDLIQQKVGAESLHDDRTYFVGKLPASVKLLPEIAKQVIDIIKAVRGVTKKCVVTDLDNTLWGGVIGDDGIEKIQVGELGQGQAFTRLQMWLKELKKRGILLAVCSKNEEDAAKLPFEKHPEMVLHLEDFAMFVANWEDKASNIRMIQETLNIGMDSLVFLDDNPFERQLVKSMIPEISVPELPEDPTQYLPFLKSCNLFETASFSEADGQRTGQYRAEAARTTEQKKYATYDEYLESLEMVAEAESFDAFHTPRIAQLSQRSNQFNLRTQRYTEDDVERLSQDEKYITIYFTLKDKFGDYGLISVVVLEKKTEDTLFVAQWLMSCRVLKRGMEEFIADTIIGRAKAAGFARVEGEYLKTPKNKMVENLYPQMGFTTVGEGQYLAEVDSWQNHRTYIALKQDQEEK